MLNPLERTFLKNYLRGDKKARLAILISAIGVLLFITVSITLPFKDRLFSMLFPKSASRAADVTAELVNLGNPFNGSIDSGYSKPLFARNVWDMQIFNGKIYLGHGDWGNNTGPTDIWSYDLASKQFVKESSTGTVCGANCVDEEAIEKYRVVDGALVIPGIDDKNSGGSGSFYRQESGSFKKYYNFTSVDHVFDIHSFNSKLFAGVGPRGTSGVKISSDSGVLWQDAVCKGATTCASRTYTLFELAGKLYASIPFLSSSQVTSLMEYDPVANVFNVVPWSSAQNMFVPLSGNALTDTARWITNESTFNSNLVYIVATPGGGNTNNWIPISLVKSSAMGSASQINLPNSATPRDTLVNGSNIYVLAHTGSAGAYTNYVFSSTDLTTWTEVLSFSHETFARSFEYQNGYFYFGMGTDSTALSNKAGDILKAKDPGSTDFTQELVLLGNPTKDRFPNNNDSDEYARNPWDLMAYNNRVYIGSGNSSNYAPRSNAGPVDLWYYDTSTNAFVKDTIVGANCGTTCVDDEQIDIYRLIDGVLYTPGHDPKNNGAGDFYRMEGTSWKAYHNSQLNYHDYDIYKFGSRLFISGSSSNTATSAVSYSDDNGTTWQVMNCQNEGSTTVAKCSNSARAWRMFELGGVLFVNWPGVIFSSNLSKYDPINNLFITLAWNTSYPFYPTLPTCTSMFGCERNGAQTVRPVNFNGSTVYIAAKNVNDHQWDPYPDSLLKATALNNATTITLPGIPVGWKSWDIKVDGTTIYVLVSSGTSGSITNYVFSSTDLSTWTEVLHFSHSTFARSFEYLNGYFYFGMGTSEVLPLADSTGDIIKVQVSTQASPTATPGPTTTPAPTNTPTPTPAPTSTPTPTPSGTVDLTIGLVGYWKMDETSGNAPDTSINNNTLTNNNATAYVTGKFGNATSLVAVSSQSLSIADAGQKGLEGMTNYTFAAWINPTILSGTRPIMTKSGTNGSVSYQFNQSGSSITVDVSANGYYGAPCANNQQTAANFLPSNTWTHVVLTYDGNYFRVYQNGAEATSGSFPYQATGCTLANTSADFAIGGGNQNGTNQYFDGKIDEVRIYNRTLSAAEISQLYNFVPGGVGGPQPTPSADTQAPTAPANLVASASASTKVDLSWDASSDNVGVTGYQVFRNLTNIATVSATIYSDTTVSPSTAYNYQVTALDLAGNVSNKSLTSTVTTPVLLTPTPAPSPTPVPVPCAIASATWGGASTVEKSSIPLNVTTSGDCTNKQVNFEVRQAKTLLPDVSAVNQPIPNPVNITSSIASTSWIADTWTNQCIIGSCDPVYFFKANIVGDTTTVESNPRLVTVTQNIQPLAIANITDNSSSYTNSQIPSYEKLEVTFDVQNSVAKNFFLPFDPAPPPGVATASGITVNAEFSQDNFQTKSTIPAFYYQDFDYQVKGGSDWIYPANTFHWKVRFAPPREGPWSYRLSAQDASGTITSAVQTVNVVASSNKGFVRVSPKDSRYFEFEDGTYFPGLGYNMNYDHISWNNPLTGNQANFQKMGQNGIQLIRQWLSQWSIFGSAGNPWHSITKNSDYESLVAVEPTTLFPNRSDYIYPGSDTSLKLSWVDDATYQLWQSGQGGFDGVPCMFLGWLTSPPSVKPNTSYHISIRYTLPQGLTGPNIAGEPYGLVAKFGGWLSGNKLEPGTSFRSGQECAYPANLANKNNPGLNELPVTPYTTAASNGWTTLEADFVSPNQNFLPFLYLSLENLSTSATARAYIDYVEIRENLTGGGKGANIIQKPSMSHLQYVDQRNSFAFDKVLDLAKQNNVYLKIVGLEKNEFTQNVIDFSGNYVSSGSNTNFYGDFRNMTKVRWLQQAWWRYMQARWGYSTNIQSWELLNEGDPFNGRHYTLTDEFGKYMKQFGQNKHLITTSMWHSYPTTAFWSNSSYPNIDYTDVHQYMTKDNTTNIRTDKNFVGDSVNVFQPSDWYDSASAVEKISKATGAKAPSGAGKPIMRGETGFVINNSDGWQNEIQNDTQGVWLHKYIWAGINSGGLMESYWYDIQHIYPAGKDFRPLYKPYYDFIKNIPLTNGLYIDAQATASDPNVRVMGQKDPVNAKAHLWIDNKTHTWGNVLNNPSAIATPSGTITFNGMLQGDYDVNWYDTSTGATTKTEAAAVDSSGTVQLTLPAPLATDIAVTVAKLPPKPCTIASATWGGITAVEGSSVALNATTTGDCANKQVSFEVRQAKTLLPDVSAANQPQPNPVAIASNSATTSWTADAWANQCLIGSCDPVYFFKANIVGDATTVESNPRLVTVTQASPVPSPTVLEWGQDGGNAQRTGYVPEEPTEPWTYLWSFNGPDNVGSSSAHLYDAPKEARVITGGSNIFVPAGTNGLYALAKTNGVQQWNFTQATVNATPAYDSATGYLYVGGADGNVYKIQSNTGAVSATYNTGSPINKAVLLVGNSAYVVTDSGELHKVDTSNMSKVWSYAANSTIATPPAYSASKDLVIYATDDLYIHAVNNTDGSRKWRVKPTPNTNPASGFPLSPNFPNAFEWGWPVIAEQSGVVLLRMQLDHQGLFAGPNNGKWGNTNAENRSWLQANPQWKNLFALNLDDGTEKFIPAVGYGSTEDFINGGAYGVLSAQPVVKKLANGNEVAYFYFRNGQTNPPSDYRWSGHVGEMVLNDTTIPGLVAGDLRFIKMARLHQYSDGSTGNCYTNIIDEQTPLSMAGDTLFNAHWSASCSVKITDRSDSLGLTFDNPIKTTKHPTVIRSQAACSSFDLLTHRTTCGLTFYSDGRYYDGPGFWTYWNVVAPPAPPVSGAWSIGFRPFYTIVSDGLMIVEGNGGEVSIYKHSGVVATPTPTPTPAPCAIASATWGETTAVEGSSVALNATTTGDCANKQVNFEVRQAKTLLPDVTATNQAVPNPVSIASSSATTSWTADTWANQCLIGSCDPVYFFKANIVGDAVTVESNPRLVTVTQISSGGPISDAKVNDWNQVGKNPQRTGYSAETLGTNFKVSWTYAFQPERVHPAVQAITYDDGTGSKIFVGTENGNMYAFDAITGAKKWTFTAGYPVISSVAADFGKVFFGAMDGAVYAINSKDGTQAWKQQLSNKGFSSSPLIADGKIMLGGRDGKFYALDPNSGNKLWEYNAGSPILQTAAWNSGKVFFGTLDVTVHAVDSSNGSQAWTKQLPVAATKDYWPVVYDGKVIIQAYPKASYLSGVRPGFPFGWFTSATNWNWLSTNGTALAQGNASQITDFMSSQDNVLASYQANPNNYKDIKSFYILNESDGQEAFTVPSFGVQSLGGTIAPPCVDRDGKLIVPVEIIKSGWGRLDLNYKKNATASATPRITDVLYDGFAANGQPVSSTNAQPKGMGNNDENLAVTCTKTMVLNFHLEEGNANYTGAFDQDNRVWIGIGAGYRNRQMMTNNQHPTDPVSVSNGMIYHVVFDELVARSTQ